MQATNSSRFIVAITGGIASGKSVVSSVFERSGITVANADMVARELVAPGQPALVAIIERFGHDVVYADGRLDRNTLRRIVFDDAQARRDLEAILHPRIRRVLEEACTAATGPYAMAEIPLLAEGGGKVAYPWLARILVVDVPREVQIERLIARDGTTPEHVERILAAQASREQRLAIADDVICNTGSVEALQQKVSVLHALYLQLATPAR